VLDVNDKYWNIGKYIEEEINCKNLKPGSKLPSIRHLSQMFGCSNSTVIKAYSELEKNHIIYSVPKSGYFVIKRSKGTDTTTKKIIDMASAVPSTEVLPYLEFQHCLNEAIDLYKEDLFSYSSPQGLLSLRKVLVKHLQNYQVFTSDEDIFITAGAQQALDILTRIPFPNGKNNVLVEQPTYHGILKSLQLNNIEAIGIERSDSGIDFIELERIFRTGNIKFFYTIPRFHNPIGTSYTIDEKKKILDLAQKYNVYIVEDDYLADLELDSRVDPIYSYDVNSRVIYLKSFSKILLPGLRLSIIVLPSLLKNTFKEFKRYTDLNTSIISQGALEVYLKSGMFDSHVSMINDYYRYKMDCLRDAIRKSSFKNFKCFIPQQFFLLA